VKISDSFPIKGCS